MITLDVFHQVAAEAYRNPRAARYVVTPLSAQPLAYPLRSKEGAVPAMALQFSVDHMRDANVHRVITIARAQDGFMVWCGDKFTQGDVSELEAGIRIGAALSKLTMPQVEKARTEMLTTYGSYPYRAPCHFWKAWHSHQGVCKHVAAVLQHVQQYFPGGLASLLSQLDERYRELVTPPVVVSRREPVGEERIELTRVLLPLLPDDVDPGAALRPHNPNGYLLWLKNGRTHLAHWDERQRVFFDMQGPLASNVIAGWAALS